MSLLNNERILCPNCGNPTPKIFPTKIEGQPICRVCENTISMDDWLKDSLTLDKLRKHLSYREKNLMIHENFNQSRKAGTGLFGRTICINDNRQLWYIKECGNEPIFRFDEVVSYTLLEDRHVIERGSANGVETYPSIVENWGMGVIANPPIHAIWLEIDVQNVYWNHLKLRFNAPCVIDNNMRRYVIDYQNYLTEIRELTQAISSFFPDLSSEESSSDNELNIFIDLMNIGVITQDEYIQMKKELLIV